MNKVKLLQKRYLKRRTKIKHTIVPKTSDRKRICVSKHNRSLYAQIIDDVNQRTIFGISTLCKEFTGKRGILNIENAKILGKLVADKAKELGCVSLYFDRNGYLYHGKIKAFADSLRENGIDV